MSWNKAGRAPGLFEAVLHYVWPDRLALVGAHVLAGGSSILRVIFPLLIGAIMNRIQVSGMDGFGQARLAIVALFSLFFFLWATRVPLRLLEFHIARRAQAGMVLDLNRRLFAAPLAWHETRHSGDTASRVQQSSGALFGFTLGSYATVAAVIQIVGPILGLAFLSPMALVGTLIGCALVAAISIGGDRLQIPCWIREADAQRGFSTALTDSLRNVMTAYAARRRHAFVNYVQDRLGDVFAASRQNIVVGEWKAGAIDVITTLFSLGLIVLYIYEETHGAGRNGDHIALGNVYIVQAFVTSSMLSLVGLVANVSGIMRQKADFATSAPIYAIEPEPECTEHLPRDWSSIELRDVALTYGASEEDPTPALRCVNLSLQRGSHYALVGANGSGKSTLLKLLAGLLKPDAGGLTVDGAPLDAGVLRNSATLVPQHPELLEGTLEYNLLVGATDHAAMEELAQNKVVGTLLDRLGVPLDSYVQEAGVNWSGGQRQRIALARGVLAAVGSSLVMIDEPTSSIDPADERVIIGELRAQFRAECLLVSVHDLELVREFDGVIVLEDGMVLDAGSPDRVRARCDYFGLERSDLQDVNA